jgi:hypothetical protein
MDVPGAAALLRALYRADRRHNGHAALRPILSSHARAEAAQRFGAAALERIHALSLLPHGGGEGPLLYHVDGLLLVEACTPHPRTGWHIYYLVEAIPV